MKELAAGEKSDGEIVGAVLGGDRDVYAKLVERHASAVFGIVWSRLGDRCLAEDAAQETFVQAYSRLNLLRDAERFGACGWRPLRETSQSTSGFAKSGRSKSEKDGKLKIPLPSTTNQSPTPVTSRLRRCRKHFANFPQSPRDAGLVLHRGQEHCQRRHMVCAVKAAISRRTPKPAARNYFRAMLVKMSARSRLGRVQAFFEMQSEVAERRMTEKSRLAGTTRPPVHLRSGPMRTTVPTFLNAERGLQIADLFSRHLLEEGGALAFGEGPSGDHSPELSSGS